MGLGKLFVYWPRLNSEPAYSTLPSAVGHVLGEHLMFTVDGLVPSALAYLVKSPQTFASRP